MAKPYAKRTLKVMEHFRKHPNAPVAEVAGKYNMAMSHAYRLRKQAKEQDLAAQGWLPPGVLPVPEVSRPIVNPEITMEPDETNVDQVLDSRAKDYGKFIEGAEIMQMLKRLVHNYIEQRQTPLAFDQREAIDMIIHKMGRIINGNPDKVDHWVDIAGYATLVAERLEGNVR
jgi:uncharacterized protein YfaT (DUF1175 family)